MTDIMTMKALRTAKHTDVNTYGNTPGTLYFLDCEESAFLPPDYERLERQLHSVDNREFVRTVGRQMLESHTLRLRGRGVLNNTGGALVAQDVLEFTHLFDSFFGANAAVPSGAATTATGGTGATPNITVASGAGFANGDHILFQASSVWYAREVISGGGTTTLTLDRTYVGTPSGTVYRGPRWSLSRATHKHIHEFFSAEFENARVDFFGCIGESLELDFAQANVLKMGMSWKPMTWAQTGEANPTYAAPTAGSEIVNLNGAFYLGSTEYLMKDIKVSIANNAFPRDCINGANGLHGYEVAGKSCQVSGRIWMGDNGGSMGELVYNSGSPSVKTLQSTNTVYDAAIEVANGAGQSCYIRIPALDINGKVVEDSGGMAFELSGFAREPSSGSPFKMTFF